MPRLHRHLNYQDVVVDKFYLESNGGSNVLQYLERRESGRSHGRRSPLERSVSLTYLVRVLIIPYKCCGGWGRDCCVIKRAKKLIGRNLWEYEMSEIIQLMRFGFNNQQMSFLDIDTEPHGIGDYNILPLTFIELVEVIYRRGCNMNCVGTRGGGFLTVTIAHYRQTEKHIKQMVKFLIKHKIDVKNPDLLNYVTIHMRYDLNDDTVEIFELLLKKRAHISGKPAANPFITFMENQPCRLESYSNNMKIIHLFIRYGYYCKEVLQEFCSIKRCHACFRSLKALRIVFAVFKVLIEATFNFQDLPDNVTSNPLWRAYHSISDLSKTPSFSDVVQAILDSGLEQSNKSSLLRTICRCYSCEDLPVVVKRLVNSGFDVNYVNGNEDNALFSLLQNFKCHRNNLYRTIRLLIEGGIDINHIGSFGENALIYFISRTWYRDIFCCRYKKLVNLNNTKYWDIIIMLLEAGCSVLQCTKFESNIVTVIWKAFVHRTYSICSRCALRHVGLKTAKGAVGPPSLEHFPPFLYVLERIICKAGADFKRLSWENDFNMLLFVCYRFKGQELIALIILLCNYGVDVNATCLKPPDSFFLSDTDRKSRQSYSKPMNAIEIIKLKNNSELEQVDHLLSILKQYGFHDDE